MFALETRATLSRRSGSASAGAEQVPGKGDCLQCRRRGRERHRAPRARRVRCTRFTTSAATAAASSSARTRLAGCRGSGAPAFGRCRRRRRLPVSRVELQPRRDAARRALRAVRRGLPEGEFLARAGRARYLGRLHLPEPVGQARRRSREQVAKADAHARRAIRSRSCAAARSSSTTCARTGK